MLTYSTVQHDFRKLHNLSCNEYILCDLIFVLSSVNRNSIYPGWCYMTKEKIADEVALTKRTVINLIQKMIDEGFLEKDRKTKHLRTTEKWNEVYFDQVKKFQPVGEKSSPRAVKSLQNVGEKNAPNNNNNNDTEKNINKRKDIFFDELNAYKHSNPDKYPASLYNKFFSYWTEKTKTGNRMRYEAEKFFELPKRLATFWDRVPEKDKLDFLNSKNLKHAKDVKELFRQSFNGY